MHTHIIRTACIYMHIVLQINRQTERHSTEIIFNDDLLLMSYNSNHCMYLKRIAGLNYYIAILLCANTTNEYQCGKVVFLQRC